MRPSSIYPDTALCATCGCEYVAGHLCPGRTEQPVRDLAQAIITGHPFTDADAILVARAFLQQHEEEA